MSHSPNPHEAPQGHQTPGSGASRLSQRPLILAIGSLALAVAGLFPCGWCASFPLLTLAALVMGIAALQMKPDRKATIVAIIGISVAGLAIAFYLLMTITFLVFGRSR